MLRRTHMSKVLEKEAGLLNNLSSSEIANELDSRLRDLEKNISVAREFIKLADESYSELRHKWNLLQEEARNKSQRTTTREETIARDTPETRPVETHHTKNRARAPGKATGFATESPIDTSSLEHVSHKIKGKSEPDKEASMAENKNSNDEKITRKQQDRNRKHRKPSDPSSKPSHL